MKSQRDLFYILVVVAFVLCLVSMNSCIKYSRLKEQYKNQTEIFSSLNEAVSIENKAWENYKKNIAVLIKESASYEAFFAKEERAENVLASIEAAIEELKLNKQNLAWEKASLEAVYRDLCIELGIPVENLPSENEPQPSEPEGEYDE